MFIFLISLAFTFASDCELPNFYAGHLNLTSEIHFKELVKKEELFVLAISAQWCSHCCLYEPLLASTIETLDKMNIKMVRADLSTQSYLSKHIDKGQSLPAMYIVYKGKFKKYDYPIGEYLYGFIDRFNHPFLPLNSMSELEDFEVLKDKEQLAVIAFINDLDEDYFQKYVETCIEIMDWPSTKFGIVGDKQLLKDSKGVHMKYFNSLVVITRSEVKQLDLDVDSEMLNFITSSAVGPMEELNPYTFQIYKTMGLPMLVMFIDKEKAAHYEYVDLLEKAARNYNGLKVMWMDGKQSENANKMRAIGLVNDILPALGFNMLDGRLFPFDDTKKLTLENIKEFIHDFFLNRLKSGPNKLKIKANKDFEKKFENTPSLHISEFDAKVLTEGTDVMLLIYDSSQEQAISSAPNYNKVALRFSELRINTLKVYRIDANLEPIQAKIGNSPLPTIFFFPAFHKIAPFIQFSGELKAVKLMFFAQKYADIKFELPELPHLSPDQVPAYWEQVNELDEEKRKKASEANERRDWSEYF